MFYFPNLHVNIYYDIELADRSGLICYNVYAFLKQSMKNDHTNDFDFLKLD